jgi:hypothetical protein
LVKLGSLVNLASEISWLGLDWNFLNGFLRFKNFRIHSDLEECVVGDTSIVMGRKRSDTLQLGGEWLRCCSSKRGLLVLHVAVNVETGCDRHHDNKCCNSLKSLTDSFRVL